MFIVQNYVSSKKYCMHNELLIDSYNFVRIVSASTPRKEMQICLK
jgi:hypothetical protein